jgi:hypothetical protein
MSVASVLEREGNVRDTVEISPIAYKSNPFEAILTPELKTSSNYEILGSVGDRAEMMLAYSLLFNEGYPEGSIDTQYPDQKVKHYACLILSGTKKAIPKLEMNNFLPDPRYLAPLSTIQQRFYFEILFGKENLPEAFNLSFEDMRPTLMSIAERVKNAPKKNGKLTWDTGDNGLAALQDFAHNRLIFGDEFDRSGIWQYVREDLLQDITVPVILAYNGVVRSIAFASILEAKKIVFGPDKKMSLDFGQDPIRSTSLTSIPEIRRFDS